MVVANRIWLTLLPLFNDVRVCEHAVCLAETHRCSPQMFRSWEAACGGRIATPQDTQNQGFNRLA